MTRTARVLTPTRSWDGHVQLDARIVPSIKHEELKQLIWDSVERTQKPIMQELPDQLFVTQQQFASLNNYTEAMADTEDRMMLTPWNVMEVYPDREHVDDREEVQDTITLLDELDELIAEGEQDEQQSDTNGHNPRN